MKNRPTLFAVALLLSWQLPLHAGPRTHGPAQSGDACLQDASCRAHVDTARTLSGAGLLAEAVKEYDAAYALRPSPWLLFNIARLLERMNRPGEALPYYQRYIEASGNEDTEQLRTARAALLQAKQRAAAATPAATSPPSAPEPTGQPASPSVNPAPVEPTAVAAPSAPSARITQPLLAGLLLGSGLALLGAGLGVGQEAKNAATVLLSDPGTYNQRLFDYGQGLNRVAIGLDIAGGICATAGLIWTVVLVAKRSKSTDGTSVGWMPTRAKSGLVLSRSF